MGLLVKMVEYSLKRGICYFAAGPKHKNLSTFSQIQEMYSFFRN
jgi:hypothetical protein